MNAAGRAGRPAIKFRYIAGSALAAALLAGCAGSGSADRFSSAATTQGASLRDADRRVAQAEKSVEMQPGQAALRITLAQAYIKVGRFESAISAFNDAMELGDKSSRTALSLALANIAISRNDEAVAVLDDWRAELAPVDIGLAYALAGQARRGAAILTDAVRGGLDAPQARQNLAYALALDGRWREARIMMSRDLTADGINTRIGEWAALASEGNPRVRVATLLGTPVRADGGQPERLALAAPVVQPAAEIPTGTPASAPQLASAEPTVSDIALADAGPGAEPVSASPRFEAAFVQPGFVSVPVIQSIPVAKPPRAVAARFAAARTERAPAAASPVARAGSHLVQLGSFTSEQGARRAWGVYTARNTGLRNYRMTVIPVTVDGKSYWRLAAAGFDAGAARTMCGTIKSRGGTCLTYANTQMPSSDGRGGPQLARRR